MSSEDDALLRRQVDILAQRVMPQFEEMEGRLDKIEETMQELVTESRVCHQQWDAVNSERQRQEAVQKEAETRADERRKVMEEIEALRNQGKGADTMIDEMNETVPAIIAAPAAPTAAAILAGAIRDHVQKYEPPHTIALIAVAVGGVSFQVLLEYAPMLFPTLTP